MQPLSPDQINQLREVYLRAQQLEHSGRLTEAESLYRQILKRFPALVEFRYALANMLVGCKRLDEALKEFKSIVKSQPTHAPTHHNLGQTLLDLGKVDDAIDEFKRAITLEPKLSWSEVQLGRCYRIKGNLAKSMEHFERALKLDNLNVVAINGVGLNYLDQNNPARALDFLKRAVQINPENAEFRVNLGLVWQRLGFAQEAINTFGEAVKLQPDLLEASVLLAEALLEAMHFDSAITVLSKAFELAPDKPELLDRMGDIYRAAGQTEAAVSSYERSISLNAAREAPLHGMVVTMRSAGKMTDALDWVDKLIKLKPQLPTGYILKSSIQRTQPSDNLALQLESVLRQHKLDERSRGATHFALGKVYDDLAQYDQAFEHYLAGNKTLNQLQNHDAEFESRRSEQLINFFNAEFVKNRGGHGNDSELPVFIVGMPRSGTSLVEQIASSHALVDAAGEVRFWNCAPLSMPIFLNTSIAFPDCLNQLNASDIQNIASNYLSVLNKVSTQDTLRITDKLPHNFLQIGLIKTIFPRAKIIHTRRHPLDTCLSIFFQLFGANQPYAYDLGKIAAHYSHYQKLMAHWHQVFPEQILDIDYEELIAAPEIESRKLIDYLGLEWDKACLMPHKLERTVRTLSSWQVRQPIYTSSVARWKNYEKHLGPLKTALGLDQ